MKVQKCQECKYYKRLRWSHSYKPSGYHAIGMSHAYGFCELHNKRCLDIKNCHITLMEE